MSKKLQNGFLAVEPYLFQLKLNPTEILTLAKILEFNRNTGDCFISNDKLASDFGVSSKTISRTMEALESKGFITRNTKNVKGGKERHIKVNHSKIEEALPKDNLSVVNEDIEMPQGTNCLLTRDNLSIDKGQNDFIKENIKEKRKDNLEAFSADAEKSSINWAQEEEETPDGSLQKPFKVNREWLIQRHNYITTLANGLYMYGSKFYKLEG